MGGPTPGPSGFLNDPGMGNNAYTPGDDADAATVTTLVGALDYPESVSQAVGLTLTATVAGSPEHPPTGLVYFYDGSSMVGMAFVNAFGVATCTVVNPAAGAHPLTAVYQGDVTSSGSMSNLGDVSLFIGVGLGSGSGDAATVTTLATNTSDAGHGGLLQRGPYIQGEAADGVTLAQNPAPAPRPGFWGRIGNGLAGAGVGAGTGALAGGAAGGIVGSIVPGPGTLAGAGAGASAGAIWGGLTGFIRGVTATDIGDAVEGAAVDGAIAGIPGGALAARARAAEAAVAAARAAEAAQAARRITEAQRVISEGRDILQFAPNGPNAARVREAVRRAEATLTELGVVP